MLVSQLFLKNKLVNNTYPEKIDNFTLNSLGLLKSSIYRGITEN